MVNQDWIEWKDLIELGLKESQFFDYLMAGLEPYERYTYEHIDCPQKHHKYYHLNNRFTDIEVSLRSSTELDNLENKVEEAKPYTFYIECHSLFVDDFFSKHRNNIFLRPIANKGYPINFQIIQKLKTYRDDSFANLKMTHLKGKR